MWVFSTSSALYSQLNARDSAVYKEAAGGFYMWLATLATLKRGILSSILQGGSDFPSSTGDLGLGKGMSAAPGLLTLFGQIVPLNGSTDHINSQSLKPYNYSLKQVQIYSGRQAIKRMTKILYRII